jgi:hypothetical protein
MTLMSDAGENHISPNAARPKLGEQFKALRTAARKLELDNELPVATFLCTYLPALPKFMDKIATAPAGRFAKTRPPGSADRRHRHEPRAAYGRVGRYDSVRGRISVFGEQNGNGRDSQPNG